MLLVVGLGNPGAKYAHTRHNVGFDVVSVLAQKTEIKLSRVRCRALVGEGTWAGERLVLAQPQTYMNLSGESVASLVNWYKPGPDRVVIVYDDIDLPPGKLRVRASGSAGTHNGMRSIVGLLGRTDIPRVRVGIGGKPESWELANWVLAHYTTEAERKEAFDAYMNAADAILCIAEHGVEAAMREYNRK